MRWRRPIGRLSWPRRPELALAAILALTVSGAPAAQAPALVSQRTALLAADDARVSTPAHLAVVREALDAGTPEIQVIALRALARTERAVELARVLPFLANPSLDVRREAAFAVAQIARGSGDVVDAARRALHGRLTEERDVLVLAALAEHYGRLPLADGAAVSDAALLLHDTLTEAAARNGEDGVDLLAIATARGAEALARRAMQLKVSPEPLSQLLGMLYDSRAAPAAGGDRSARPAGAAATRVRRLAAAGLQSLGALGTRGSTDQDAQVRRLAVIAQAQDHATTTTAEAAGAWLQDEAMVVRHEAVRRFGPRFPALARDALRDGHLAVRLAAMDALGQAGQCAPCATLVARPPPSGGAWHEFAHALVALARTDPAAAASPIDAASRAEVWQVRMYAARAAGVARRASALGALAADAHVNVRHAAVQAWHEAKLPGLEAAAVAALASDDGQLLLAASNALAGAAPSESLGKALRDTLARVTAQRRDTSRDVRLALLARVFEIDPQAAQTLRAYVTDFDEAVARKAADMLRGPRPPVADVAPRVTPAAASVPSWEHVAALQRQTATLALRGGRRLSIRLYAANAPTNAARFAAQIHAGEWNGRTFHRVEPGFVVQGGSPAANEYAGAPAFTRDEISSLSHVRGTVGISTRGRDTGDGQIFINLVDNPRLDFTYTIIGAVTGDLAVLDDLVEGDEVERATLDGPDPLVAAPGRP